MPGDEEVAVPEGPPLDVPAEHPADKPDDAQAADGEPSQVPMEPPGAAPIEPPAVSAQVQGEAGAASLPADILVGHLAFEVSNGIVVGILIALFAFVTLQGEFRDLYTWARGSAPSSGAVSLVTIGEEALYLWDPSDSQPEVTPRGLLARLVHFLDEAGARVVVLDVLLEETAESDDLLAAAGRAHGSVVAAERFRVSGPSTNSEFQVGLNSSYDGAIFGGFANLQLEEQMLFQGDALVRAIPLTRRVHWARLSDGQWPLAAASGLPGVERRTASMGLTAAWLHTVRKQGSKLSLGELQQKLRADIDAACVGEDGHCEKGTEALGLAGSPETLDQALSLNFRGPEMNNTIPTIRAADLLRAMLQVDTAALVGIDMQLDISEQLRSLIKGKVVVVGRVDLAADDRHVTPYAFPTMLNADMAGCRVQAQFVDNLLSGTHIRVLPAWLSYLFALVLVCGIWGTRCRWRRAQHMLLWSSVLLAFPFVGALWFSLTDGCTLEVAPTLLSGFVVLLSVHLSHWAREEVEVGSNQDLGGR